MNHLAEAGVLVLEQLGDAEEERGGLLGGKLLPRVEEETNLGEQDPTFSRMYGGAVEQAGCSSCYGGSGQ